MPLKLVAGDLNKIGEICIYYNAWELEGACARSIACTAILQLGCHSHKCSEDHGAYCHLYSPHPLKLLASYLLASYFLCYTARPLVPALPCLVPHCCLSWTFSRFSRVGSHDAAAVHHWVSAVSFPFQILLIMAAYVIASRTLVLYCLSALRCQWWFLKR